MLDKPEADKGNSQLSGNTQQLQQRLTFVTQALRECESVVENSRAKGTDDVTATLKAKLKGFCSSMKSAEASMPFPNGNIQRGIQTYCN